MPSCFVIQPFDGGKFDKRFKGIFAPAIAAAELEPYRVDNDPAVQVPIDAIEDGIRNASVCLADITTDNPNVWYELGFSFASGRPVVMVCSDERVGKKYPFDIQHRSIITYGADAPSDFDDLKTKITTKLLALLKRDTAIHRFVENEQVAPVEGLSFQELTVLAAVAGSVTVPEESASLVALKNDVERAGVTAVAFQIGLRRLRGKKFVETDDASDGWNDDSYKVVRVTELGWEWIDKNEEKFLMRRKEGETMSDPRIPF